VGSTWHHGLVARWWAEFNVDGPEIAYFRSFVEAGQPALDVACGTGRLLLPYVRDGLDVDGCDVSRDMVELCGEAAAREGLAPTLFVQAMHELDPPRRYATIYVCGGFGLGSGRAQDLEALERFHAHLEPGGTLVLDNEVPYAYAGHWARWTPDARGDLPRPWGAPPERRAASDGSELGLQSRLVSLDPLGQRVTMELRACRWVGGELDAEEEHTLTINLYFTNELVLMLERAGFVDVELHGDHEARPPTAESRFVVFVARKPR
jgi:SAM-dependent methyltransferase